ncbi:MAG: carboxypeptidase-like regulatory domain-containing protein [Planctomycetaceae bacterium]
MRSKRLRPYGIISASLAFLVLGCSSEFDYGPRGTISGRLTLNSKPLLPGTHVSFMEPEKGYLAFGTTDAEGNYTVNSAFDGEMPIGTYGVMIQPPAGTVDPESLSAEDLLEGQGKVAPSEIPAKYRQFSTSGLSYPIQEGPNTIDIVLP